MATQAAGSSMFAFLTGWQLPVLDSYFQEKKALATSKEASNKRSVSFSESLPRQEESMSRLGAPEPRKERKKVDRRTMIADILGQGHRDVHEDYLVGRKFGKCKFGSVHSAMDRRTSERVLCKSVSKKELLVAKDVDALKTEIAIMHCLTGQANCVHLLATYEDSNHVHLILEWCSGDELLDLIVGRGTYTERQAASIFRSIMEVVKTCHFLGIMLRNIKLENFRYSSKKHDAVLKFVDFSEAVFFKPGETFKDFVGSLTYMAPEVLYRKYSSEADNWSCGVFLHILLSGEPPFAADSDCDIFQHILEGSINFNSNAWSKVSEEGKNLTRSLLSRNPQKRITAKQALEHEWLKEAAIAVETPLDPETFQGLQKILSVNKMKRVACQVIAKRLPKKDMKKLQDVFEALDKNKDGSLSYHELRDGFEKVGLTTIETELETLLEVLDLDKGGSIDYNEFLAGMLSVERTYNVTDMARAFHHFDADDNGYITLQELREALEDEYELESGEVEQMIRMADVDGNGEIDFEEFMAMMQKTSDDFLNSAIPA